MTKVYIFSHNVSGNIEWTTNHDLFQKMMSNDKYTYKGWINQEYNISGGPGLQPVNGTNMPTG